MISLFEIYFLTNLFTIIINNSDGYSITAKHPKPLLILIVTYFVILTPFIIAHVFYATIY